MLRERKRKKERKEGRKEGKEKEKKGKKERKRHLLLPGCMLPVTSLVFKPYSISPAT